MFASKFFKTSSTVACALTLLVATATAQAGPPAAEAARLVKPRPGGMVALNPQPIPPGRVAYGNGSSTTRNGAITPYAFGGPRPQIDPAPARGH